MIAPTLWSGWTGDDAFFSVLNGVLRADHHTVWQAMAHASDLALHGVGRFYPIHLFEKYLVFTVLSNVTTYKIFLILITLLAVEMFRRCISTYTSPAFGALCALIAITLFQERGYHDPILAYNGMIQCLTIAMLGSLMAFRRALLAKNLPMGMLALSLYVVAALLYEDAYALCLIYPVIAGSLTGKWRVALSAGFPYVIVALGLTAFGLAMRGPAHIPAGSLYAWNLNIGDILRTGVDQVVSALPLNYWWFDPSGIFSRADLTDFLNNAPVSPIVFAAFAVTAWFAVSEQTERPNSRGLWWVGGLMLILPAIPIALIVKYQHELRLGLGYLPVFIEVFAVALLLGGLSAMALDSKARKGWRVVIVLVVAIVGTMTQATNVRLVRELQPSRLARLALERQVARGLMSSVPQGSDVSVKPLFDWIVYDDQGPDGISTRGLFYMYGRSRVDLVPPNDPTAVFALQYDAHSESWTISPTSR